MMMLIAVIVLSVALGLTFILWRSAVKDREFVRDAMKSYCEDYEGQLRMNSELRDRLAQAQEDAQRLHACISNKDVELADFRIANNALRKHNGELQAERDNLHHRVSLAESKLDFFRDRLLPLVDLVQGPGETAGQNSYHGNSGEAADG